MTHTVALTPAQTEPKPVRITRKMMYLLLDAGLLEEKTELVDGILYHKMPHTVEHFQGVRNTQYCLSDVFGMRHVISQLPFIADDRSEPEPDVFVTQEPATTYAGKPLASAIQLIVEVAHHSLLTDKTIKAKVYARNGIPEYWILDVVERALIVHRDPTEAGYNTITTLSASQEIFPLAKPTARILITDLLP